MFTMHVIKKVITEDEGLNSQFCLLSYFINILSQSGSISIVKWVAVNMCKK